MSTQNPETTNNTWQPDPLWDYYLAWHSLQYVKSKIDETLAFMAQEEFGSARADAEMKELLEPAKDKLTEIMDKELIFADEETDEDTA